MVVINVCFRDITLVISQSTRWIGQDGLEAGRMQAGRSEGRCFVKAQCRWKRQGDLKFIKEANAIGCTRQRSGGWKI